MAQDTSDLATADPLVVLDRPDDPQTDPFRMEVTLHPAPDEAARAFELPHDRWVVDMTEEHVNPRWDEWFEVVTGTVLVEIDGEESRLSAGEDVVIPADVPHRHFNPAAQPARVRYEARPGLGSGEVLETLYTLAQAGKTNAEGMPNPIQFAVIQAANPGQFYSTAIPRPIQRAMTTILGPVGRLLGYRAAYSMDEIDALRS